MSALSDLAFFFVVLWIWISLAFVALFHSYQSSLDLTLAFITKDEGTHSCWRVRYSLETIDSKFPKAAR